MWPFRKNRKPRHYVCLLDQFGQDLTNYKSFEGRTNMSELIFKPVREKAIAVGYRIVNENGSELRRDDLPEHIEVQRNERPRVRALVIRVER